MRIGFVASTTINKKANYGFDMRIGWLIHGLLERGHKICIYALENSAPKKNLVKIFEKRNRNIEFVFKKQIIAAKIIEDSGKFDIIHSHCANTIALSRLSQVPILHTVSYADFSPGYVSYLKMLQGPGLYYVAISNFLKGHLDLKWSGVVHNGICTSHFCPAKKVQKKYFLSLGRIIPEKGVHLAVQYCHRHKLKLVIAGMIQDQYYFDKEIKKYLNGNIKFIGEVGFKQKIQLYQGAIALLAPIQYNEAFGNTLIEANSCGTPVVVFNRGAAGEIIRHGKTGFVVEDMKDFDEAARNIGVIDANSCRQNAVQRFTYQIMANNYEKMYFKIIEKHD